MTMFVTAADLAGYVGATSTDDLAGRIAAAVNHELARYTHLVDDAGQPTPSARQGALMLAGRLYRRKNSLGGLETLGDAGVGYVARSDADIDRLLGLGQFATPMVG